MISVGEAKNIIRQHVPSLSPISMDLEHAAGLILGEDVFASMNVPSFDQSAMDGYAFCFDDYESGHPLLVTGVIPAGHPLRVQLQKRQAVRIFTGAPIPDGADTVVMQEKVLVESNNLIIQDSALKRGGNVRPKGSEIEKGALALAKETYLSPAAIGFLAGIGISNVTVYPKPSITLLITGRELAQPGQPLEWGQVYESNSYMLRAALHSLGITDVAIRRVDGNLGATQEALNNALQQSGVVLLTGGISVGDYDYVLQATKQCGVTQLFYKVAQKPGKPLYFGMKDNRVVFGLPGNPASVLTCFYEYVVPALEALTKRKNIIKTLRLPLTKPVSKKGRLTNFLKGYYTKKDVTPLQAQESYRLRSFAHANCLICLDEQETKWSEGAMVAVHILPY